MEIIHGHLARQPTPIFQLCKLPSEMLTTVSAIVLKLMEKNAEDRYQSAFGLRHDLDICLHQLKDLGRIEAFQLRGQDICDRFLLPEKLYGRQAQIARLLAAFERTSQGSTELMLVAGHSGIGKTAVINEVHKPITRRNGYFIAGKYDQLQRNVPLSAFIQAFRRLVQLLLGESDGQLNCWKQKIQTALGQQGQILLDVIPELIDVIGPQPPVAELPGNAAENRFNRLMQTFVRVFTGPQHPLVIFLDDLQWADAASLKLLQLLMQDNGHLLIIGAYRDNEVLPGHPLLLTIEEIREPQSHAQGCAQGHTQTLSKKAQLKNNEHAIEQSGAAENNNKEKGAEKPLKDSCDQTAQDHSHINTIALAPLSEEHLTHLVADTLHSDLEFAQPLSELIYQRTNGNPFFSSQCLLSLEAEEKITFSSSRRRWEYDPVAIESAIHTDDVVEFMGMQLQKLPPTTQSAVKIAACIGAQFDLATLAIAAEIPAEAIAKDLWQAIQEGLIIPTSNDYKIFFDSSTLSNQGAVGSENASKSTGSLPTGINPGYRFLHDRVQQAAYALIEPAQQAKTHYSIGQRLLLHSNKEQEKQIFDIVNHLNKGQTLIVEAAEREQLLQLNLQAGRRAQATVAYASALEYLSTSLSLLPEDCWQTAYDLTLTLYNETAEAALLTGELVSMQRYIDQVLTHAHDLLDKAHVYEIQLQAAISQDYFLQSIEVARGVLAQLD
ncbi:MAG: AAA family ATPase, partial [Cyanobacteria bacterium J06632_3]